MSNIEQFLDLLSKLDPKSLIRNNMQSLLDFSYENMKKKENVGFTERGFRVDDFDCNYDDKLQDVIDRLKEHE